MDNKVLIIVLDAAFLWPMQTFSVYPTIFSLIW